MTTNEYQQSPKSNSLSNLIVLNLNACVIVVRKSNEETSFAEKRTTTE